jgi:hypothetical protein
MFISGVNDTSNKLFGGANNTAANISLPIPENEK